MTIIIARTPDPVISFIPVPVFIARGSGPTDHGTGWRDGVIIWRVPWMLFTVGMGRARKDVSLLRDYGIGRLPCLRRGSGGRLHRTWSSWKGCCIHLVWERRMNEGIHRRHPRLERGRVGM
jgi:hypothetical protein